MDPVRIAILGGGSAGLGWALACMQSGAVVTVWDPDCAALDRIGHFLSRLSAQAGPVVPVSADWAIVRGADWVILALDDKTESQAACARLLADDSAWQYLAASDLSRISPQLAAHSRVIGLTLAEPSILRNLAEISLGAGTSAQTGIAATGLAGALGKVPVQVGTPIYQRLLMRCYETAESLLMEGAIPHELDTAMAAFGYDIGLFEAQDLIGLDDAYRRRKQAIETRDSLRRHALISDRMVEEGRLGKKVGVGWYRYPGGGGAVIDPLLEDLIREEARFAKVTQREFGACEMVQRLHLALVHEMVLILAEDPDVPALVLDQIAVSGLGFPADRAGPLAYADRIGLGLIIDAMDALNRQDPVTWAVVPLLAQCSERGQPLAGLGQP